MKPCSYDFVIHAPRYPPQVLKLVFILDGNGDTTSRIPAPLCDVTYDAVPITESMHTVDIRILNEE